MLLRKNISKTLESPVDKAASKLHEKQCLKRHYEVMGILSSESSHKRFKPTNLDPVFDVEFTGKKSDRVTVFRHLVSQPRGGLASLAEDDGLRKEKVT